MEKTFNNAHWREYCAAVPQRPGVYKFLGQHDKILYVGKAKNLRNRLNSWLLRPALNIKHQALLARLSRVDFVTTINEIEALLLESNLIKEHKPKYNVLLKDNKSYPWIRISEEHDFPGVYFHRGSRKKAQGYFGPYPDTPSVRRILKLIYRVFRLRQCPDTTFKTRHRPCIQHQIGNCEAPCVGLIDKDSYRRLVAQCRLFLKGKRKQIVADISRDMRAYSEKLNFEAAAKCRDRLEAIRVVNTEQAAVGGSEDIDFIVAGSRAGGQAIAQVLCIRGGINLGIASKRLKTSLDEDTASMIRLFVIQHYRSHEPPRQIVTERLIDDGEAISGLMRLYHPDLDHSVAIISGEGKADKYRSWLQMARANLDEKLAVIDLKASMYREAFAELGGYLPLGDNPRIDCLDVSHLMGSSTVCSSVSCDDSGRRKDLYRLYKLDPETGGDDLAGLREALGRKLKKSGIERDGLPSVLLIDGGVNQWRACHKLLVELSMADSVSLLSISKHENRKLGMEYLHFDETRWIAVRHLNNPLFRCLLDLRNEAHRFAISAHREQRRKSAIRSRLDGIPSVGAKRKQVLLGYFRDAAGVQAASEAELAKVPGISKGLARQIHEHFHADGTAGETGAEAGAEQGGGQGDGRA